MRYGDTERTGSKDAALPITLLWFELTSDSTAAGAHLRGTIARLDPSVFDLTVVTRSQSGPRWLPEKARKPWRILSVVGRARVVAPRGVLLARWSPFVALVSRRWTHRGRPLVLFVQGNLDDMYESNPWTRRLSWVTRLALASIRDAAHIVTPSEGLADWVSSVRGSDRSAVTVIPNGVDLPLFEAARSTAGTLARDRGDDAYAVFFGNMATWQGIDTILEALADPRWPPDLALEVIGDGQLAEAVQVSTDPRVHYRGRRPKAEVARVVARAEMALATRHDDAASATGVSPFKIIEAAAAGTPSIVTRVPGQTELALDIGGSLMIPPDDPAALAEAVATLHADPRLRSRLSGAGLSGVRSYDWAARSEELTRVITAVSTAGGSSVSTPTHGAVE